jgi:hypothetical protein
MACHIIPSETLRYAQNAKSIGFIGFSDFTSETNVVLWVTHSG